jgi:hypothetical protein
VLLHLTKETHVNPARIASIVFLLAALLGSGCAHVAPAAPVTPEDVAQRSKVDTLQLDAPGVAPAPLRVRVYLPPDYDAHAAIGYPVLYVNDGQDMEAVGLQATLAALYAQRHDPPVIVVAVDMPPDRMGAYGLSDRAHARSLPAVTKYGPVGTQAHAYSEWVAKTLVPTIDVRYRTRTTPDARAVLGWSLGALNAFNLGWQYPRRSVASARSRRRCGWRPSAATPTPCSARGWRNAWSMPPRRATAPVSTSPSAPPRKPTTATTTASTTRSTTPATSLRAGASATK